MKWSVICYMVRHNIFDKNEIVKYLHYLDDSLLEECKIEICGSSIMLLNDYVFTATRDVDFVRYPGPIVISSLQKILSENNNNNQLFFDTQAPSVVCLLEDYEDRLIEFKDNFKFLRVYLLSIEDWIVTQLESKKFERLLEYTDCLTKERLQFIEDNMHLYCGLKPDYAKQSLKLLWEVVRNVGSDKIKKLNLFDDKPKK